MAEPDEEENNSEWVEMIKQAQRDDPVITDLPNRDPEKYLFRENIVRITDDNVYERVLIPDAVAWDFVDRIHRYLVHFGTDKVTEFIEHYFAINNRDRIVVASCHLCMATKIYTRPTRGPEYYDFSNESGKVVSLDLYGPLPKSHDGNVYVIMIMDKFSKYTKMYPIKNQKLKTLEEVLEKWYFPDVGRVPEKILTDCGGQFITNRWREFAQRMGFGIKRTSPYNPQSNPVERVMRELGRALRAYACDNHRRWDDVLSTVEQVLNATDHSSTIVTPTELEGRVKDLTIGPPRALRPFRVINRDRDDLNRIARERLQRMADKRKRNSEKHETANKYKEGDCVWLRSHKGSDMRRAKTRKLFLCMKVRSAYTRKSN